MTDLARSQQVNYFGKDFAGFKRNLLKFSQAHHSGVLQDYNEASPGMALLETQAFVGDVLAFYIDQQFNEIRQETAVQAENVVSFAKSLGYRPSGKRAARGVETFFIEIPATTTNGQVVPDDSYAPIMQKGAQVQGPNGTYFETLEDLIFSASIPGSQRQVTGSQFDDATGLPTHFAVRKDVAIVAGQTVTDAFTVSDFQPFLSLALTRPDVLEVISVVDSDGSEWTEVDYLAQDAIFDSVANSDSSDSSVVPYVMKLVSVPRRFVTDRDPVSGLTSLVFGSGDGQSFDDELIPNLADLALPLAGRRTFSAYSLDPQNFLKTRSLGLSPYNTSLTVTYRVGGGQQTNVPPGSVKSVSSAALDFSTTSLDVAKRSAVVNSLECTNVQRTDSGGPEETISEIKANSAAFFAAQNRVVTREDFVARVLTLPAKFGRPDKIFVKKNGINPLALDIHILARDPEGHLTLATTSLKNNIRTYLTPFRMITDGVNILDGKIINLRVKFGVTVSPRFNRTEVLTKCLSTAKQYFELDRQQISHPVVVSDFSSRLQAIQGVVSVYEIDFVNVVGRVPLPGNSVTLPYSSTRFDVSYNRQNEILYCPPDSIFEVKYPTVDIEGVVR